MSKSRDIIEFMRGMSDDSVDLAMGAALATADQADRVLIVEVLLQRGRSGGLVPLIQSFHHLSEEVQARIVAQTPELFHALREAMSTGDRAAANAITIITRSGDVKLAYLLSDQLRRGAAELRPAAAKALVELVEHAPTDKPEVMQAVQTAVREAMDSFKIHRQSTVLLALAALAPRDMATAAAALEDRNHPALEPMRRLMTVELPPEIRRSLLAWATVKHLTAAAVVGIERSCKAGHLEDVLAGAHLLHHGQAALGVHRLPNADEALPRAESLATMAPHRMRWLPAWACALPVEPQKCIDFYSGLHAAPDAATRLAAMRRLISLSWSGDKATSPAADTGVSQFCADTEQGIARIALRHLVARRWDGLTKLLLQLVNSPHEEVRRLAGAHLAPLGFARLWDGWPRLNFAQQLAGGAAMIKLDPGFHRVLGEKLTGGHRASRLRAIAIIQTLNQADFFTPALIALSTDTDEVVASAAVKTLVMVNKPESVEALKAALNHKDARVRANAVESLHALGQREHEERLLEMAEDDANRPRANAIGALMDMRTAEALASLIKMLADPRPSQRASALWLVDHMGLIEVARNVAELAVGDPDYEIKSRAAGVMHRMIDSLRPKPKPPGEPPTQSRAG